MKKLISIGVALALLTMAVVPGAVAAQDPIQPSTYSKIPFAIIGSGMYLVGCLLGDLGPILEDAEIELPLDLGSLSPIFNKIGDWTAGPLGWAMDMMAWGVGLSADVMGPVLEKFAPDFAWATDILDTVAEGLRDCWEPACNDTAYAPCP